ncbi:UPF0125 protein RatB [hydrothermal vent metagenome]|uniref:UPF0125 protein RatB n=1 Tax=hydrothermal vent metagenome TaxID=652676 RepID=A0A3B1B2P0_9ZZZZ
MADSSTEMLQVEVAYAEENTQIILSLDVPPETNLLQAVEQSGILEQFPEIDLEKNKLGIFGKISKREAILRDHDRVEIYRPLIADPKASRRKRAEKKNQASAQK